MKNITVSEKDKLNALSQEKSACNPKIDFKNKKNNK